MSGVDLAQWLGAQLDEDERIARAVPMDLGHSWSDPGPWVMAWNGGGGREAEVAKAADGLEMPIAEVVAHHIAEHDPARVLREIEAKRRLLDEVLKYEAKIDGEWGCCHDGDEIAAGECAEIQPQDITALRLLALPYANRPGYQEGWAP